MSDCGHAEMGTLCTKCGKVIVPLYRADSGVIDDMVRLLALIEQYRFEDGYTINQECDWLRKKYREA